MAGTKRIKIDIPEPEAVINPLYLPLVTEAPETLKTIVVEEGGRGSGKSRAIAQSLTLAALRRKMRIALVRKVADTIRDSSFREIQDVVAEWNLAPHFQFNESMLRIRCRTGSTFIAKGLDKAEKTKSLANVDLIWVEEATELTLDDYITLSLGLRGETTFGQPKRLILSFNRAAGNWTEQEFFFANGQFKDNPDLVFHQHSTFHDNQFLDKFYLQRLEAMRLNSPELYEKNALGLPIALKGLIFTNWDVVDEVPVDATDILFGMDFGYNDPKVLVKLYRRGHEIWIDELIYRQKMMREDFIAELKRQIPEADRTKEQFGDAADPETIEAIYRAGFNIRPADKGKDSVLSGIEEVQSYKLHVTRRSTNIRKDFENYKWKEDKNGNSLDEPMHEYSHGPDAIRYPVHTFWGHEYRNLTEEDMKEVELEELETITIFRNY